jgi:aryl-phospho-beta-D-glucosidase BglC (GH1 family)
MAKSTSFFALLAAASMALADLPSHKIRGVNLGSLFIVEPWMSSNTWKSMGCDDTKSEWDCVVSLGQEKANAAFQNHWNTFITADDFDKMKSYGINTVRIPVGHWFVEETIIAGENWPRGGMQYLDKVAGLAASRDIDVIIDLHGAPGVQVANNAFTGHVSSNLHPRGIFFGLTLLDNRRHGLLHPLKLRTRLHLPGEHDRAHPHALMLQQHLRA